MSEEKNSPDNLVTSLVQPGIGRRPFSVANATEARLKANTKANVQDREADAVERRGTARKPAKSRKRIASRDKVEMTSFTFRFPQSIMDEIQRLADEHHRSPGSVGRAILEKWAEDPKREDNLKI